MQTIGFVEYLGQARGGPPPPPSLDPIFVGLLDRFLEIEAQARFLEKIPFPGRTRAEKERSLRTRDRELYNKYMKIKRRMTTARGPLPGAAMPAARPPAGWARRGRPTWRPVTRSQQRYRVRRVQVAPIEEAQMLVQGEIQRAVAGGRMYPPTQIAEMIVAAAVSHGLDELGLQRENDFFANTAQYNKFKQDMLPIVLGLCRKYGAWVSASQGRETRSANYRWTRYITRDLSTRRIVTRSRYF